MTKSKISNEIINKIKKLKDEKTTIKNIIDIIFNEDNIKISKYMICKLCKSDESESKTQSEQSQSEKEEPEEEQKEEEQKTLLNNWLIKKLNDSNAETEESEESEQSEEKHEILQQPQKLFKVDIESNNKQNNNIVIKDIPKNNIVHDVIKNIDVCTNIDEMKEKRWLIIIIRQYIKTFKKELSDLNINEKQLFNYDIMKLKVLLENIRIELNLKKNSTLFIETSKNLLVGYEKVMCYSGIDIKGVWDELINNPDFIYDLQMISCEIDISRYINPKWSAFLKVLQSSYYKYEQNKIINNFNEKINNDEIIEKLKNIQKK